MRRLRLCLALLLLPGWASAQVITDDLPRFLAAYGTGDTVGLAQRLDQQYLRPGTSGIRMFTSGRIRNAEYLARVIRRYPKHYAGLPAAVKDLPRHLVRIDSIQANWQRLYPAGKRRPVYIVVGAMNSGGTTGPDGVIIGLEMYARRPDTDTTELTPWHRQVLASLDRLPAIVAHELVHTEQRLREPGTLLTQALREGMADFLGELICGQTINPHLHAYARGREAQLWADFERVMDGTTFDGWLYGGNTTPDRPADLGYWIGYQISKAYYTRQPDKAKALRALLQLRDAKAILQASGYHGQPQ